MYQTSFKQKGEKVVSIIALTALIGVYSQFLPLAFVYAESATSSEETSEQQEESDEQEESDSSSEETEETQETDPAEEESEEQDSADVETGDAVAGTDVDNEANTNITQTEETDDGSSEGSGTSTDQVEEEENDGEESGTSTPHDLLHPEFSATSSTATSSTPDTESESGTSTASSSDDMSDATGTSTSQIGDHATGTASTTVTNTNDADIENNAQANAETGENQAAGESATVKTGDAVAFANVVNLANTNILNSRGFIEFFNQVFGNGSIDLRDLFSVFSGESAEGGATEADNGCSLTSCGSSDVEFAVENSNEATIKNNVVVRSSTGGNSATGTDGTASIETGDAYAGANVVNVANTNITDSNYLLVSFNNLGSLNGDVVLPSANFFSNLFQSGSSGSATVTNENEATITNNASTTASTGENTSTTLGTSSASSTNGTASIETGDASASTNVVNHVNQNLFGSDSLLMVFRIHSDWSGDILGLPEGISWAQTSSGIQLFSTGGATTPSSTSSSNTGSMNIENENEATIENNVDVFALTGDNKAEGESGASVETGDAQAGTNIVNVANTNVLGQNWALLVFNIFGDWNGDISFGRPDLWVGTAASSQSNPVKQNSTITYDFTIVNNSDTDATEVVLENTFNRSLLGFHAYDREQSHNEKKHSVEWDIGTVKAGEAVEVSFDAQVTDDLPYGETPLTSDVSVHSRETDDNPDDNTDSVTLTGYRPIPQTSGGDGSDRGERTFDNYSRPSELIVSKSASVATTTASSTVSYTISIKNRGGSAYKATLVDTLENTEGDVMSEGVWDLKQIYPGENITVEYDVGFSASSTPGNYVNYARVYALDTYNSLERGEKIVSNTASTTVSILEDFEGQVLGATTCEKYITSYLRFGKNNDQENVARLQTFLRDHEGYDIAVTGVFNKETDAAVRSFQEEHRSDVLDPWSIGQPTGYVYYTTQTKINNLYCDGQTTFSLTDQQRHEIASYRQRKLAIEKPAVLPASRESLPEVGLLSCSIDESFVDLQEQDKIQTSEEQSAPRPLSLDLPLLSRSR